jgi:hypothetical protein
MDSPSQLVDSNTEAISPAPHLLALRALRNAGAVARKVPTEVMCLLENEIFEQTLFARRFFHFFSTFLDRGDFLIWPCLPQLIGCVFLCFAVMW